MKNKEWKTKWKTKDGRLIKIKDMTDQHLINTIKMLIKVAKNFQDKSLTHYPNFNGEMAQYYAEKEWEALADATPEDILETECLSWEYMIKEANKRNLDISFLDLEMREEKNEK